MSSSSSQLLLFLLYLWFLLGLNSLARYFTLTISLTHGDSHIIWYLHTYLIQFCLGMKILIFLLILCLFLPLSNSSCNVLLSIFLLSSTSSMISFSIQYLRFLIYLFGFVILMVLPMFLYFSMSSLGFLWVVVIIAGNFLVLQILLLIICKVVDKFEIEIWTVLAVIYGQNHT